MAQSLVLSGLVKKRAATDGELHFHQKKVMQLKEEIATLDSAILIFEPEYNLKAIETKRKVANNKFFNSGERGKTIMDILRDSGGANLTAEEVALEVVNRRNLKLESKEFKALIRTLIDGLRDLKLREVVKETSRVNNTPRYCINIEF